jgi:hypothetical protein
LHAKRIEEGFGISSEVYWAIYAAQNGRCYICEHATGKRKRLAVDHEHNKPGCDHDPKVGCPQCIRALLCGPCNKTIGRLDAAALSRAIEVLISAPAQRIIVRLSKDG